MLRAAGRLVAQCALLCADQRNQRREEEAAEEPPRHRHSPHFQRSPTHSPLQHFLSGSGNKTSGAGLSSRSSGQIIRLFPGLGLLFYILLDATFSNIAHRIYKLFTVALPEILEDGFSPSDICPYFGHCGSSAGQLY